MSSKNFETCTRRRLSCRGVHYPTNRLLKADLWLYYDAHSVGENRLTHQIDGRRLLGKGLMKVLLWLVGLVLAASSGIAQDQPPLSGLPNAILSYQEQPSVVEQAKASGWRPPLEPQVTYSGALAEMHQRNSFRRTRVNKVVHQRYDDVNFDLITQRPRGIVLFAINF